MFRGVQTWNDWLMEYFFDGCSSSQSPCEELLKLCEGSHWVLWHWCFQTTNTSQQWSPLCSWEGSKLLKWFHTLVHICISTQFDHGGLQKVPWTSWLGFWSDMHCELWAIIHTGVCVPFLNHVQSVEFANCSQVLGSSQDNQSRQDAPEIWSHYGSLCVDLMATNFNLIHFKINLHVLCTS